MLSSSNSMIVDRSTEFLTLAGSEHYAVWVWLFLLEIVRSSCTARTQGRKVTQTSNRKTSVLTGMNRAIKWGRIKWLGSVRSPLTLEPVVCRNHGPCVNSALDKVSSNEFLHVFALFNFIGTEKTPLEIRSCCPNQIAQQPRH